jgi:hypothetical protein
MPKAQCQYCDGRGSVDKDGSPVQSPLGYNCPHCDGSGQVEWTRNLQPGDEVTWNDPADACCSHTLVILEIERAGDVLKIMDTEGNRLECLAEELS